MKKKLLSLILILPFFCPIAFAAETGRSSQASTCKTLLLRDPENQTLRESFIQQYADNIYVSEPENHIWIERSFADKGENKFYVVTENAWLKKLNDSIIKDKDLVTALTNYHKELILKHLKLQQQNFLIHTYSDFKSLRFEVEHAPDEDTVKIFETAFFKANQEFFNSQKIKNIVRAEDLTPFWFTLGFGASADEASLAAREARNATSKNELAQHFWNPSLQADLETQRNKIIETHKKLLYELSSTPLIDEEKGELVLDVYTHARKATTAQGLLASLKLEFPKIKLNEAVANEILTFIQAVDEFSPSMLIAKRELLSIHDAPFGAISIDFIGLGAENIKSTATALIRSKNLSDAIKRTRTAERRVTRSFEKRKQQVEKIVKNYYHNQVSIRFSGDDGVIIPFVEFDLRDQLSLVYQLSKVMPYPYFRMTSINEVGASSSQSSELISHGESIEKTLRSLLLKSLGRAISKKIHIQIFNPDITDHRDVFLILNIGVPVNSRIASAIQSDFHVAINKLQEHLNKTGSKLVYSPGSIFTVKPETINTLPSHWNSSR